jgi:hypothetical protein
LEERIGAVRACLRRQAKEYGIEIMVSETAARNLEAAFALHPVRETSIVAGLAKSEHSSCRTLFKQTPPRRNMQEKRLHKLRVATCSQISVHNGKVTQSWQHSLEEEARWQLNLEVSSTVEG